MGKGVNPEAACSTNPVGRYVPVLCLLASCVYGRTMSSSEQLRREVAEPYRELSRVLDGRDLRMGAISYLRSAGSDTNFYVLDKRTTDRVRRMLRASLPERVDTSCNYGVAEKAMATLWVTSTEGKCVLCVYANNDYTVDLVKLRPTFRVRSRGLLRVLRLGAQSGFRGDSGGSGESHARASGDTHAPLKTLKLDPRGDR